MVDIEMVISEWGGMVCMYPHCPPCSCLPSLLEGIISAHGRLVYSGLLSSHDMEPTSPPSPLPHGPLSTLVSSDLSGQDCCFLVLSRGVTDYTGDRGLVWTGERRLSWVSSCTSSPVISYSFCILLLLSVVILVHRLLLFRLCANTNL